MKHYIIASLLLACVCFAQVEINFTNLSSHKGDIWTIRNSSLIIKVNHGLVHSNALTIKWNIKKGRMKVRCDGLCNDDDIFAIRMFDKDSLRIDYVSPVLKPDTELAGDEYIIPADVRKDIAFMEIVPINDNWVKKYEVTCDDGYTKDPDGISCIKVDPNDLRCDDGYTLDPDGTTCIEIEQKCPPSWQDTDGKCLSGWYSN